MAAGEMDREKGVLREFCVVAMAQRDERWRVRFGKGGSGILRRARK